MIQNNKSEKETLKDIPLFSELDIKDIRKISEFSLIKKYDKNEVIFSEGDNYTGFYIVLKGKVKVYKLSRAGKESVIHIIQVLEPFAEVPLFEGYPYYPVYAQTLEECILFFIPGKEFIDFTYRNPHISLKIISGFAKKLHTLTRRIENLTLSDVPNRLAKYIMEEYSKSHKVILSKPFVLLNISKSTLAGYLGTITETLSRTFKKLQDDNVIEVRGRKIFLIDIDRLRDLSK
ncbi:MAG: Crp/Fnr family transcriptional regulator [Ignavibacteriaceae bacterium]|nr:Crp/Fnr family transcriptional regulator [Ignavibacteriaceae bacterium]